MGTTRDWMDHFGFNEDLQQEEKIKEFAPFIEDHATEGSYDANQAREAAEKDLDFLAALAMPLVFKYLFPPILKAAWGLLLSKVNIVKDYSQIALGIPRGLGKTALLKLFILYCILFTKKRYIMVIAATEAKAINIVADVFDMLDERNIKILFGDWRLGKETDTQTLKKFGYRGRPIAVEAMGVGGSIRGSNIKHERPDVMVFDDIQTKEASQSLALSTAIEDWLFSTAMKAKSPNGCLFIFCGNMYPGPNSLLKKLKKNRTWIKFISGAILADGTALWEDLRSYASLIEELDSDIEAGHPEIFFSEVLNETEVSINSRIDLSKFKPWPWQEYERPQGKFIIIDPASGKLGRDDVAIGYFEVYDQTPALREVEERSLSPRNTILTALSIALRNRCKLIACEATGYQSTLLYWFSEVAKELGITGIEFVEIHTRSISKNYRIGEALKELETGDQILHPAVRDQVVHQIANWNPLKRDNVDGILDLLGYCTKVMELYSWAIASDTNLDTLEGDAIGVDESINSLAPAGASILQSSF